MVIDKLYELAFAYKKAKPWKKINESQVFAVRLPDGRIGYISIMGDGGEYYALSLFIGDKGLKTLRVIERVGQGKGTALEREEIVYVMDCLNCVYDGKDALDEDEYEAASRYAREHKIRISGKKAFPHFLKYRPGYMLWPIQRDDEREWLCRALEATMEMLRQIKDRKLHIPAFNGDVEMLPLMEYTEDGFTLSSVRLPEEKPASFPEPIMMNDINLARLKKIKKGGVWECKTAYIDQPAQNSEAEAPVFPLVLFAANPQNNEILPPVTVFHYEENASELLNEFVAALLDGGLRPREIRVCEERTYALMKSLCKRLKISLTMVEKLEEVDKFINAFQEDVLGYFDNSNMEKHMTELLDLLLEKDKESSIIERMPPDVADALMAMTKDEEVSPKLKSRLNAVMDRMDEINTGGEKRLSRFESTVSYVISVSLTKGCYRHIQISSDNTLERLSDAILDAFDFDNDHAHAFFMDNKKWSDWDCYYMDGMDSGSERLTNEYTLEQAELYEGKQFKYVFDFGDEWVFQCKVLKIKNENTDRPVVIRKVGEAPKQYDWDDDFE